MPMLNLVQHNVAGRTTIASFRRLTACHSKHLATLCRPKWTSPSRAPRLLRLESTAAAQARTPLKYPELLNVYRAGTTATVSVGLFRVTSIGVFIFGTFYFSSAIYFSPDHSNWLIPLGIVGSAVPMVAMALATGPMIHSMRVYLPARARRSKEELRRFAENTSFDTTVLIEYMKWKPWIVKKEVRFGDLRKLRPSWKEGIANLEHVPDHARALEEHQGKWWFGMAQRYFGRYYVARDQVKDRSAAPGLFDKMWEQIPAKGGRGDPFATTKTPRRPINIANRPVVPPQRAK